MKKFYRRSISGLLALLICFTTILSSGVTAFAASSSGETAKSYSVAFPRDGDANLDTSGTWGHDELHYMNGWTSGEKTWMTTLHTIGDFNGPACYCIEPGVPRLLERTYARYGEDYWKDYPSECNSTIDADTIKTLLGRIMQYGYQGNLSLGWRSQNDADADKLALMMATQVLVWETVVGERDANFNHVDPGGADAVKSVYRTSHPLYSRFSAYYDSIEASVKKHTIVPSFMARSTDKAQMVELSWDGSRYAITLTDTNGVLGDYTFSSEQTGITFVTSGNTLTITAETAPTETVTISATKNNTRKGVVVWSDGHYGPDGTMQDVVTYSATISDPVKAYSELLNSLDSGATTKITINNRRLNRANFEQSILMPMRGDTCDVYRREYNQMLLDKATGANGIIQEKYITVSVCKKDIEEARTYFARIGADLIAHFAALGSKCTELDAAEKLRVLHDFYRQGEEAAFHFDPQDMMRKGHDFKDYICPDSMEKSSDCLKLGEKYCRVLFLKDYASYIKDSMVTELTDFNRNMMLSIDVVPIPTDEAVREVENRLLGIETNITNWQRRQNANNNFSAVVPYDMELQRKESKEFLDDLTTRDQRMMLAVITMVITADDKKQLDSDTETVLAVARKHMCQLAVLKFQQLDGLNTVLPIGTRRINAFRTLTTESLAVFMPFKVQEVQDKGGIYFGENAISHNLIMCNKANLLNQSAFLLGVPGSGKSFSAKELIAFLILNTADDVLICDPENEFGALAAALGKETATVIHMAAGGKDRLNAMYMVDGYGENNPIVEKSQFIMSLVEQIDKAGVGPQQKSIIDRCTALVYQDAERTGKPATLCDLRNKLLEQPEEKAKEIALSLELFTTGSLDIFGHESTVDLDKRIVVFDIHGLGEQLKPTGLLVITDTILNRVTLNWKKGKRTHIFIDEFHVVFENEQSGIFFNSAWRQFRKRNGYPTAITQNVEYLLDSVQASTMLSNSEFVVMLNQAFSDRAKLSKLLNISDEQMSYVTNADAGCGLIKYGSALVPFINRFPKDTELYRLMTTRPGEGVFGSGNAS